MGFLKCLVCYEDVESGMRSQVQDNPHPSVNHKRKTLKNSKLLKDQVSIIFLVRSLLEVPLDECAKYLEKYGNPSQWITLCEKCNSILKEALDINDNIMKLSNDLKNIKERLINQIKIKVEEEDGDEWMGNDDDQDSSCLMANNATQEIRRSLCLISISEFRVDEEFNDEISSECPLSDEEKWNEESVPIVINPLSPMFDKQNKESDSEWSSNLENIARKTLTTPKRSGRLRKRKRDKTEDESHESKILPLPRKYKKKSLNSEHEPLESASDSSETSSSNLAKPKKMKKNKVKKKKKEILVKHSRFFCDICNLYFLHPKYLNQHTYEVHNFGIKCTLCEHVVTNCVNYEDHHRSAHHPKSISTCSGCDKWMTTSYDFNYHLKKSPKCLEKAVVCDTCKKFYSTQESLELHKEMRHINPPPPPFRCLECNLHFSSKQGLKLHMAAHHASGKKPFTCDKCGNSFALEQGLKSHVQIVHINKEPDGRKYPCGDCDLVFTSKNGVNRHRKLHGEESPFLCTICGKRYKVGNQLTVYMWSHDPDRHLKYSTYKKGKNKPRSKAEKKKLDKEETKMAQEARDKKPEVGEQKNDSSADANEINWTAGSEPEVIQSCEFVLPQ